jgi:hypothetical protein
MNKKTPYGDTVQLMDLKNDLITRMHHIETCKKHGTDPYDPNMRASVDKNGKAKAIMYFEQVDDLNNIPKEKLPRL